MSSPGTAVRRTASLPLGYDRATTAELLLLLRRFRLRLRLQRLWIEADIEDVGITGPARRHRIFQILRHQAERHTAVFRHRNRGLIGLGGRSEERRVGK